MGRCGGENTLLKTLFDSVGDKHSYPRRRIKIPTPDSKGERAASYIVCGLIANARSPVGRAARGLVAMSKGTGKLVFLKDSGARVGRRHGYLKVQGKYNFPTVLIG